MRKGAFSERQNVTVTAFVLPSHRINLLARVFSRSSVVCVFLGRSECYCVIALLSLRLSFFVENKRQNFALKALFWVLLPACLTKGNVIISSLNTIQITGCPQRRVILLNGVGGAGQLLCGPPGHLSFLITPSHVLLIIIIFFFLSLP